jgi:hypothetical protein
VINQITDENNVKTHIVAMMNGQKIKLFSLNLSADGSITIGIRSAREFKYAHGRYALGFSEDNNLEIQQQYYSVHPSEASEYDITTIKHTFQVRGGGRSHTYSEYLDLNKGFLGPIYFHLINDRLNVDYELKSKLADGVVCLTHFDPKIRTLMYGIFVSRNEKPCSIFGSSSYKIKKIEMGLFTFHVIYCYLNVCSNPFGYLLHTSNRGVKKGQDCYQFDIGKRVGYSGSEARKLAQQNFTQLVDEHAVRVMDHLGVDKDHVVFRLRPTMQSHKEEFRRLGIRWK